MKNEVRPPSAAPAAAPPAPVQKEINGSAEVLKRVASSEIQPVWTESPAVTQTDPAPIASAPATTEAPIPSPTAAQYLQPVLADAPKPAMSTDIQLHLTGNDQSSASIRVMDRAGSVNISVHASDPQLRTSLHSNLSELSGQLNDQGWKTEVKPAGALPHAPGGQENDSSGKNQSNQQQQRPFTQDESQSQRYRRPNQERWQEELEQQLSGNDATPGGTN